MKLSRDCHSRTICRHRSSVGQNAAPGRSGCTAPWIAVQPHRRSFPHHRKVALFFNGCPSVAANPLLDFGRKRGDRAEESSTLARLSRGR